MPLVDAATGVELAPGGPLRFVTAGLFDLQANGAGGVSFNSGRLTPDEVRRAVACHVARGTTALLPTLVTNEPAAIRHALRTLALARADDPDLARRLPGFHMEGPWISPANGYRGAHPVAHVSNPDWGLFESFNEAAGGLIRLVTLAPERPGALPFIERLVAAGVVVALGHTEATGEQIRAAVDANARLTTHLGNGLPQELPRHANPVWELLSEDRLSASIIADGHHLPPAVLKAIVRAKSPERLILVSDASSIAGMPPGRYRAWDQDVDLTSDGRVSLAGSPYLAGSGCFLEQCVAHLIDVVGVDAASALAMATARPRQLLGLPEPTASDCHPDDRVVFDARGRRQPAE
jgi:N-acetylglucosamine-6-phosphate deacetylase